MILNFQNILIYATLVNTILIKKYHSKTAIPGVPSTNRLDDYTIFGTANVIFNKDLGWEKFSKKICEKVLFP